MKITQLTVVDDKGVTHVWDGVNGSVNVRTINSKAQPYQRRVEAQLLLPAEPDVKA